MTGRENAEVRADLILGDKASAAAYARHFNAQLRAGKVRRLLWTGYMHFARSGAGLAGFDAHRIW
jgi:hypothetical protein